MDNSSFVPEPRHGAESREDAADLRFGYTLRDLRQIARYAARDCRWAAALPWPERVDTALSALAEHLYGSAQAPSPGELRTKAWTALSTRIRRELRHHGFDRDTGQMRTGFLRFWNSSAAMAAPEDAVVERLARAQIWRALPATLRDALEALAEGELTEDPYGHAAHILGVSRAVAATRISRARAAFLAHWHEHEEPSRLYSRHRPRREGPDSARGARRPATVSITQRHRQTQRANGGDRPRYNRARRVELPVSDAELARRYYDGGETLAGLAAEYGTTPHTVRRRIAAAGKAAAGNTPDRAR